MSTEQPPIEADPEGDLEQLWAQYAEDGMFVDAIEQEGYTSFAGGIVREVNQETDR